jgi:hypothetical protein
MEELVNRCEINECKEMPWDIEIRHCQLTLIKNKNEIQRLIKNVSSTKGNKSLYEKYPSS